MKLYKVTVEFTYYALAESPREAEKLANAAGEDAALDMNAQAVLVGKGDSYADDWDSNSCVYSPKHSDEITLLEAMEKFT